MMKMMKLKYNVEIQAVLDKYIAVLSNPDTEKDTRVLNLNVTSADILNGIKYGLTEEEIYKKIAEIYDIDECTAMKDVKAFIENLKYNGIVE